LAKDPYRYFRVEARELIDALKQGVLELEKASSDPDLPARMLRSAHTLKGAARAVKQARIAELSHLAEDVLTEHAQPKAALAVEHATRLLALFDECALLLQALDGVVRPAADATGSAYVDPAQASTFAAAQITTKAIGNDQVQVPTGVPATAPGTDTVTPVQATSGVITPSSQTTRLLEGAIDTVRVEIRDMDALLRQVSEISMEAGLLRQDYKAAHALRDTARLLIEHLAKLPDDSDAYGPGSVVRSRRLAGDLSAKLEQLTRALSRNVDRMEAGVNEVREAAQRLRLVPAHTVFPMLDRAVRDAALELGKRVEFEASGGQVHLDAHVLASLRDALMHVVRNAVVHGIETAAERAAQGKTPAGHVRLQVERMGSLVSFTCRDDGRGVDWAAVRAAAIQRGLLRPEEAATISTSQLLPLLGAGGLSTSARLTELAGRGIGLDVVRATALRLKGEFQIRSEMGAGVELEVRVPMSVASLQGLIVEAGGGAAVIPLTAVRCALRLNDVDIVRAADRQSILHEGNVIPFVPLESALERTRARARRRSWSAIVVQGGQKSVAIGVDRLIGSANVLMRPLPALIAVSPVVAGAALDAEGNPQLVLDPYGLVLAAEGQTATAPLEEGSQRAPVLVVDDSLTTRMLEQSILESAGYEVELAACAEEGLEKARATQHSLFIVDVEMPGMNGFEFIKAVRTDPLLRDVPAILVTSRNGPEDRRRGEAAGAQAYIVKGEFDQDQLLATLRRLVR
jgi:two-component system, chemotaxis family, sensor kinase CheA